MRNQSKKAEAISWGIEPLKEGISIPLTLEIDKEQIELISKELIPQVIEDKWFMYFEKPYLYLHRSWTGQAVFKLKFTESSTGYFVSEALLSSDIAKTHEVEIKYQGEIAFFLVSHFQLEKKVSYPMQSKKKWWQIWV